MNDLQIMLSAPERDYLVDLLQTELREVRVEEHRTKGQNYRQLVVEREECIESLLRKLGEPVQ